MRFLIALPTLAIAIATSALIAQASPASGPTHYSTADTPIGILLDDPDARAILERHIPAFTRGGQVNMIRGVSLKSIQGYALQVLTDQALAEIDSELVKLTPKVPLPPSRMTTDEVRVRPYTLPDPAAPVERRRGTRCADLDAAATAGNPVHVRDP